MLELVGKDPEPTELRIDVNEPTRPVTSLVERELPKDDELAASVDDDPPLRVPL